MQNLTTMRGRTAAASLLLAIMVASGCAVTQKRAKQAPPATAAGEIPIQSVPVRVEILDPIIASGSQETWGVVWLNTPVESGDLEVTITKSDPDDLVTYHDSPISIPEGKDSGAFRIVVEDRRGHVKMTAAASGQEASDYLSVWPDQ